MSFVTKVPGKFVLAGEHAVLRGAMAVALPHPDYRLTLEYQPLRGSTSLEIEPQTAVPVVKDLLNALSDHWNEEHGDRTQSFPQITGKLILDSNIPMGAGLGSSAALCVALAQWLQEPLSIPTHELFDFAKRLEHRFHGKSSGMDIAVVLEAAPILFSMERGARVLDVSSLPKFTFHDTGHRTRTSECVMQVERFREENPFLSMKTDEAMSLSARNATEALLRGDEELLADAMKQAQNCFYTWQLIPGDAKRLEETLYRQGAKAVKITGAGAGGYLVALWGNDR